jgi:hypothetical protein
VQTKEKNWVEAANSSFSYVCEGIVREMLKGRTEIMGGNENYVTGLVSLIFF